MRIIGLDLSIRMPAICIMDLQGKAQTVVTKKIPKNDRPRWERISYVARNVLSSILSDDLVFIEDYAYAASSSSDTLLKELGAVVRFSIMKRTGVWPVEVGIGQLKKWVTGKGNAKGKGIMIKEVFRKYGQDFDDDNLADAYGLADFGFHFAGLGTRELKKYEKEVIAKITASLHPDHASRLHRCANIFRDTLKKP